MKKIILSLSLIASFTLTAGECSRSETSDEFESPIAYMDNVDNSAELDQFINDYTFETSEYDKQLTEFLENDDDTNIQLIAYLSSYDYKDNKKKNKKIKQILKKAINLGADKYTMFLADNLCHTIDKITSWCHKQKIHEIRAQVDPENVMTYLSNIHEGDSKDDIQEILLTASENSTHSRMYFNHYTLELAQTIQDFNDTHPIIYTESLNDKNNYMSQFAKEIKKEINEDQLRRKGLLTKDIDEAMSETSPIISAIGTSMALISMPTTSLFKYCQNPIDANDCVFIAKTFISDLSMMNQGFGIRLLDISNKLLGKEVDSQLKNSLDAKYQEIMCYMQSKDVQVVMLTNIDIVSTFLKDSIKHGDMEATRRMSFTIYNIEKQHGYNPDFNPNDCK